MSSVIAPEPVESTSDKEAVQPSNLEFWHRYRDPTEPVPIKHELDSQGQTRRIPYRLSLFWYTALIAIVTALAVGAIVGGAVGGTLSNTGKKSCQNQTTATITITTTVLQATATDSGPEATALLSNYTVADPTRVVTLSDTCDTVNWTRYENELTQNCGMDYVGNDVVGMWTYTFDHCVQACRKQNGFNPGSCQALTWENDMRAIASRLDSNCWLKSAVNPNPAYKDQVIGAIMNTTG